MMTTNIFSTKVARVYFHPKEDAKKSSNGILILVYEHKNTKTLESLLPFFNSIPATGNKAYRGTAVTNPNKKATIIPSAPDFSPMILISVSRSTQTSSSPMHIKMGVRINKLLTTSDKQLIYDNASQL